MKDPVNTIQEIDYNVTQPVQTDLRNVITMFETIVATGGVPAAPSTAPKNFRDQIKIYKNDAVWKLYIWDAQSGVWKNVTIA